MKHHISKPALLLLAGLADSGVLPGGRLLDTCSSASGQVIAVPQSASVQGIADDGRSASGINRVAGGVDYYLWHSQSGLVQAGVSTISSSIAPISGDGHVFGGADPRAFVVSDSGIRTNIGTGSPDLSSSRIEGLSVNGTAAAGWSQTGIGSFFAGWRWTAAGGLQFLPGFVTARGISGDGSTVVGTGLSGNTTALVWRNGVTTSLPEAPGSSGVPYIEAWGTNFDGSIVVGGSRSNAAVWRNGQGMALPLLPGSFVQQTATDLSDDGNVIVGTATFNNLPDTAFIWTPSRGTELLSSYFASLGVNLPSGYTIGSAVVTPDGRTFGVTAGGPDGFNHGYIVTVPTPTGVTCMFVGLMAASRRRRS